MFNNKLKKSGSGAALLAAAPTLALQAQGGVEAAAVNSPQALNIVGDSFKGSGSSATKALKILPWVGGVACVVLFLVYWGCCVKNNLNLSKKYEGEILKKEKAGPTEEALAKCEKKLKDLDLALLRIERDINNKIEKKEVAAEFIREEEARMPGLLGKITRLKEELIKKEKYIKENEKVIEELKKIASDSERLEKEITCFHHKVCCAKKVEVIKEIIAQVSKENPELIDNDLLKKEGNELLESLSDKLIKGIEKFVEMKEEKLTEAALSKLEKNLKDVTHLDEETLKMYLTGDYEDYLEDYLQDVAKENVNLSKLIAEEKKQFGNYELWSLIGTKLKGAKINVEKMERTGVDPEKVNSEELLKSIEDLKERVEEKGKVLPNKKSQYEKTKDTPLGFLKKGLQKKEDCLDEKKFSFTVKGLELIRDEAECVLKRKFSTKDERYEIKSRQEFIELDLANLNSANKRTSDLNTAIENLKEQKKYLEERVEEEKKAKSSMEQEIAYKNKAIGELKKHKEKLDQNFWLPYPYSFENNAQ